MYKANIFLFFFVFLSLNICAQSTNETTQPIIISDEPDNGSWVEMEIIDGCLDIQTDDEFDEDGDGVFESHPNFRISLTDEQIALDKEEFHLEISDGTKVLLSGYLSNLQSSTPPLIFSDVELGIYTIHIISKDETYECMMKVSFVKVMD